MTEPDQLSETRIFDPIFPRLVKEESPGQKLIGFIAYGLYLEAKQEWLSALQAREKRYPVHEELCAYERSWTASRLEALEKSAAQVIAAYTDSVMSQVEKQILRGALKGRVWRAAWHWAVGALLYTLLLLGLAVGLTKYGVDLGILDKVIMHRSGWNE